MKRLKFGLVPALILLLAACSNDSPAMVKPKLRTFSIVSSGDILLHERLWAQAKADGTDGNLDFYPQLADLEPVISSADLALCHLETPLAEPGVDYQGYPTFNAPPQITDAIIKLGFDVCGTASNHSLDQGFAGLKRTIETLDAAGIRHTGTAVSQDAAGRPLIMDVKTENGIVKVGILSYTYGFNGSKFIKTCFTV